MDLQKINVKFFVMEPNNVPLADFIEIFHHWIQATDGVYHDIADYSHMQAGPGIVLVASDANVSIDERDGRRGLLYDRKAPLEGSNQDRLSHVFESALDYCRRIEEEPALKRKLKFRGDEVQITINDRLLAPNTEANFLSIKTDLEQFLGKLYSGAAVTSQHDRDPRKRLNLQIKASVPFDVATLQTNLERQSQKEAAPG